MAFDIRDLVSLEDAMEELKLGPNGCCPLPECCGLPTCATPGCAQGCCYCYAAGHRDRESVLRAMLTCCSMHACARRGLLYCMEYLEENLDDWLSGELQVRPSSLVRAHACMHSALRLHAHCTPRSSRLNMQQHGSSQLGLAQTRRPAVDALTPDTEQTIVHTP